VGLTIKGMPEVKTESVAPNCCISLVPRLPATRRCLETLRQISAASESDLLTSARRSSSENLNEESYIAGWERTRSDSTNLSAHLFLFSIPQILGVSIYKFHQVYRMTRYSAFVTTFMSIAGLTQALGINCRGSVACEAFDPQGGGPVIQRVIDALNNNLDDNGQFPQGPQLGCSFPVAGGPGAVCAFLQDMNGQTVSGAKIKSLANDLVAHKCKACGSVPVDGGNDVSTGQLTINFVGEKQSTIGGFECENALLTPFEGKNGQSAMDVIIGKVDNILNGKDGSTIPNDQAVYCLVGSTDQEYGQACVIPRGTPSGMSGQDIKTRLTELRDKGCKNGGKVVADGGVDQSHGTLNVEFQQDCPQFVQL
jgi:hypothetical protein